MKNRTSGFTLIELIVVMAIIMILAGLLTGAAVKAKQRALIAQTKTMISGLETALGMFQMDLGGYPNSGNANLVTCLITSAGGTYTVGTTSYTVNSVSGWSGPYMNFKAEDVVSGTVRDAWGTAFTYNRPGTNHAPPDYTTYVDMWSWGPNKTNNSGGSDDVSNWTR